MTITLTFLGAAGTVTGSKYYLKIARPGGKFFTLLVDAGMFQGTREWRERNWVDPAGALLENIDACLLTHAHLDHTGILPRYVRSGMRCPVYASAATLKLSRLLLLDSAKLQEEEAVYRSREHKSRHSDPQPLYTKADAELALSLMRPVPFHDSVLLAPGIVAKWSRMGHILGAGAITLEIDGRLITFSGDIGRYHVPILKDPEPVHFGDLLLIESTYGDRDHPSNDPRAELGRIVRESVARGGTLLVPSFAVGRAQLLLYYLRELQDAKQIPEVPIIIDSPMASDATALYMSCKEDHDEALSELELRGIHPFTPRSMRFIQSREESIALNAIRKPMILISASGMLTGGRILHHLKHRISDPATTLLFVGFQPEGGRGAWIQSGATSLTLFGEEVPIRAHIETLAELSAHAGRSELLRWCRESSGTPTRVAVVHGEPASASSFRDSLTREVGWSAFTAAYQQEITID